MTRKTTTREFCIICWRPQCDGHRDGLIPDHIPTMISIDGTAVSCNICGRPITHDFKGNPEQGPLWRQVMDAWYEGPDVGSNHQNDDDVDFCETCWDKVIKPLFKRGGEGSGQSLPEDHAPAWGSMKIDHK